MSFKVNVKWGKQIFKDVEIQTSNPIEDFKVQLFSLSGVSPDRQKVMIPRSGQLKDGTSWDKYKLKNGMTIMLVGSVGEIKAPEEEKVFLEDLPASTPFMVDHQPGLINTGNTCYLNSTVQALSAVSPLQQSLVKYADVGSNPLSKHLGLLMSHLNEKKITLLSLGLFTTALRDAHPQFAERGPNGVFMQQDAEECYSLLLQSMNSVPGTKGEGNIVSELFEGEFDVTTTCVEDPEDVEHEREPFSKLAIHIDSDTTFLQNGIKKKMSEHITKTSQTLGRQAVFEKTSKIAKLPLYLNIQFVRFFWRQDKNLRAKICKPVEFPFRLDLFEFCTGDLQKTLAPNRDAVLAAEEKALNIKRGSKEVEAKEDDTETKDEKMEDVSESDPLENDTGLYELLAVVSHQGRSAEGGHYVAWVKKDEENWLLYDDDRVSVVPADDVKKLTGHGGADWHIAYLCIYGPLQRSTLLERASQLPSNKK